MIEPDPNCKISLGVDKKNNIYSVWVGEHIDMAMHIDHRTLFTNIYINKNNVTILEILIGENDNIYINKKIELESTESYENAVGLMEKFQKGDCANLFLTVYSEDDEWYYFD